MNEDVLVDRQYSHGVALTCVPIGRPMKKTATRSPRPPG
jgi:hypothetical protein